MRLGFRVLTGISLVALVLSSACGRKGPPKPPETFAPRAVETFTLRGTVEGVALQWRAPQLQADGEVLTDLERFRIYRADFVEEGKPDFDPLAEIPYEGPLPEDEEDQKDSFKDLQKSKASSTEVTIVEYLDETPQPGRRYLYYVVPFGSGRTPGAPSQTLMVTFIGEASQVELYLNQNKK